MISKYDLTIHEAHQLLKKRELSSVELTKGVLERIHHVEDKVRCFVTITEDAALAQAREADERIKAGKLSPLTGIPALIKDNMCTRGVKTTCSSKMLGTSSRPMMLLWWRG